MKRNAIVILVITVTLMFTGCTNFKRLATDAEPEKLPGSEGVEVANLDLDKVPFTKKFEATPEECKRAILQIMANSGEPVESASNTVIKGGKVLISKPGTFLSAIMGGSEIYAAKSITLMKSGNIGTEVSLQVETFRKSSFVNGKFKQPKTSALQRVKFWKELEKKFPSSI